MFVQRGLGLPRNLVETTSIPVIISLLQKTDMVAALQDVTLSPTSKQDCSQCYRCTLGVADGAIRNHHAAQSPDVAKRRGHVEVVARGG